MLTARLADPTGYCRIVRNDTGQLLRVVEDKDCVEAERAIDEINTGVLAAPARDLLDYLPKLLHLECFYVGMTGIFPEERFKQHKSGYKSSYWPRKYGVRLRPDIYEKYNNFSFPSLALDFSFHLCAFYCWSSHFGLAFATHHEHLVESYFPTNLTGEFLYAQSVSLAYFELFSARSNNRVHRIDLIN